MSDFFQNGIIATFHRLGDARIEQLEQDLWEMTRIRGVTLVLPSLFAELQRPALKGIIQELRSVRYIREILIALGPCTDDEFKYANEYFSVLPQKTTIMRVSGDRITALVDLLRSEGLSPGPYGKGLAAWLAYGYVIADGRSDVIALHDCDIVTYSRELVGRLIYPVVSTQLDFEFCKGYYGRVTNRMHGRVTRLFLTPLIRALMRLVGPLPVLQYLDSFRYPLSGEFSMMTNLARLNRIPGDWGLEVGVLAEIYRNCSPKRVCQVELCHNYEHKHQELSPDDKTRGLHRMAIDIAKSLFVTLESEGVVFSSGFFNSLRAGYQRIAQNMIVRYEGDAMINGLEYDRHLEGSSVDLFTDVIREAGDAVRTDPIGAPLIPNWNRVFAAIPDFGQQLLEAVQQDNLKGG
jgi:glucosyl-3-phosphoglycerate synthase